MKPVVSVFMAALSLASCTADVGVPVVASCPRSPESHYFPVGTFGFREWYSKHLVVMGEPSLSCGSLEAAEAYRFLWLRTFDNPVAVRVSRRGEEYEIEAVILDGQGGYDPGKVSHRLQKRLSRDEWQSVLTSLYREQYWQMPTNKTHDGLDGAHWIIEGRRAGRYHVVDRWTHTDEGIEAIGILFLRLGGLDSIQPMY